MLQNIRKLILDYEIAEYKKKYSPLELSEEALEIREATAAFLHQVNPNNSIEECYNSDVLLQNGEFLINNELYQQISKYQEQTISEKPENLEEKLLETKVSELNADISILNVRESNITAKLEELQPNEEEVNEKLAKEIVNLENEIDKKKKVIEYKAAEFQVLYEKELEFQRKVSEQSEELEELELREKAAQQLEKMFDNMILSYKEIVSNQYANILEEERKELDQQLSAQREEFTEAENDLVESKSQANGGNNILDMLRSLENNVADLGKPLDKKVVQNISEVQANQGRTHNQPPGGKQQPKKTRIPVREQPAADAMLEEEEQECEQHLVTECTEQESAGRVSELDSNPDPALQQKVDISEIDDINNISAREMAAYLIKAAEAPVKNEESAQKAFDYKEAQILAEKRAQEYQKEEEEKHTEEKTTKEELLEQRDERLNSFRKTYCPKTIKKVSFIEQPEFVTAYSGNKSDTKVDIRTHKDQVVLGYKEQQKSDALKVLEQVENEVFG